MLGSPRVVITQRLATVMCTIDHFTTTDTAVHAMRYALIEMIAVLMQQI